MTNDHDPPQRPTTDATTAPSLGTGPPQLPIPSRRGLALLVAAVFAVGLVAGAALGPAPTSSLAEDSTIAQRVIALLAARASEGARTSALAATAPATSASEATSPRGARDAHLNAKPAPDAAPAVASDPSSSKGSSSSGSTVDPERSSAGNESPSSGGESEGKQAPAKPARLPPIQHVWLITLAGSTFAAATVAAASYPYLVGQLLARGALLTSYSALDAYELAGDATLLPGGVGANLSVISEPACAAPPSQASPACLEGSQPSPAEADAFLQRIIEPILSGPAYRENGLIVVSFAPASSTASASTTTLAPAPTAGALLLSPLLHAGMRSASPFNSLSPRASVAAIFKH